MIATIWFFVMLFAVGDHVTLQSDNPPVVTRGLQDCMNLGVSKMIDRRNKSVSMHCIEADDWEDLRQIMLDNFKFGGQAV